MPNEETKYIAIKNLGNALKTISEEEAEYLKNMRAQIDQAVKADSSLDKQLEFCYGIIFAPDKIKNESLIKAARMYINAAEE